MISLEKPLKSISRLKRLSERVIRLLLFTLARNSKKYYGFTKKYFNKAIGLHKIYIYKVCVNCFAEVISTNQLPTTNHC